MIGIIVVLVIAGAAWVFMREELNEGDDDDNNAMEQTAPAASSIVGASPVGMTESTGSSAMEGNVKEFKVTGSNFKFDAQEMKVKEGDTVKITFVNAQGFHNLVIDEFNVATKQTTGPGEETVTFVADKAGTYEYYCSVGQHRAMGMKGNLIVE